LTWFVKTLRTALSSSRTNWKRQTDHDHLGKLLTYLVNLDARAAIWVTSEPRPEHQKVIDWLNENTLPTSHSIW